MTYDTQNGIRFTKRPDNLVPHGKLAGSKWDHDDKMLRFQRQQALYVPLEKSEPVRGYWKDWAAGIILFATIAGVIIYSLAV